MHFGEEIDEERFVALLRPGADIHTLITADVYGSGACDALVGRALDGLARDGYALVGAVGHDFYDGERQGVQGLPALHQPRAARPRGLRRLPARAPPSAASSAAARTTSTCCMLHNPDRIGYSSEIVWHAMAALRDEGMAAHDRRGPRPGQRLHARPDRLPRALRRPDRLGDDHPQPVRALAGAPRAAGPRPQQRAHHRPGRRLRRRLPRRRPRRGPLPAHDHRAFRPEGWVQHGRDRLEKLRPIAEAHGLSSLQLACQWTLAHPSVECVVPTLVQEPGPGARPVEDKRADLAAVPTRDPAEHGRDRRDRGGRRERRLHAPQGRHPRPRGRRAGRLLAAHRRPAHRGRRAGASFPSGTSCSPDCD